MTSTDNAATNKEVLLKLIKATTQEEVTNLIENHPFFKSCQWKFYGNLENNAGIIKAQSPDPIGALVEKITNGIDALLTRKCWEKDIIPDSVGAPKSQRDAIKLFFSENVANFELSEVEIRDLAQKTVRIVAEVTLPHS